MALQLSTALRDAMASQVETVIGASPTLEIRTGAPPANAAASDTGAVLATLTLPANWLADASGGAVALAGSWAGAVTGTGDAGHFRIKASGGAVGLQGTVSQRVADGGSGDLQLDRATVGLVAGDALVITAFSYTQGNA